MKSNSLGQLTVQEKYQCYEYSVQSPQDHVDLLRHVYVELVGKIPFRLREDFCGTFAMASRWVKQGSKFSATVIDLDPEPLDYGIRRNSKLLTIAERKRLRILQKNVLTRTTPKSDLVCACNFSFFCFHERHQLKAYFESVYASLQKDGILVLEMAGGSGFIEADKESKSVRVPGLGKVRYTWEQFEFDPISHLGRYGIHFKIDGRKPAKNVFSYHWRIWSIPELRDLLIEVGFDSTVVYWEKSKGDRVTGDYEQATQAENYHSWVAYLVALRIPGSKRSP